MSNQALAIIPCYNEEASVAKVVSSVHSFATCCDVLVVVDGGTDRSAIVAREAGARVLVLPCNLGIGGAMQAGYQFALRNGYCYAVQVDGDDQHPAADIPRLLAVLQNGTVDMVVGSRYLELGRFKGRVSSVSRVMGGMILSLWLRILSRSRVTDPTSGFRAVNAKVIAVFAEEYPCDYPEPVSLLMLRKRSLQVQEIPVRMKERVAGTSSIKSLQSLLYMIKVMWRMALERTFR